MDEDKGCWKYQHLTTGLQYSHLPFLLIGLVLVCGTLYIFKYLQKYFQQDIKKVNNNLTSSIFTNKNNFVNIPLKSVYNTDPSHFWHIIFVFS